MQLWKVVVGGGSRSIAVRDGFDTSSTLLHDRLEAGGIVQELEVKEERLHFRLITGVGPDQGWASLKLKETVLFMKMDSRPRIFDNRATSFLEFSVKFPPGFPDLHAIWSQLPLVEGADAICKNVDLGERLQRGTHEGNQPELGRGNHVMGSALPPVEGTDAICTDAICDYIDVDPSKRFEKDTDGGKEAELWKGERTFVYKARDKACHNRLVVIKKLQSFPTVQKKIKRELQAMKKLIHPNICKCFATYLFSPTASEPIAKDIYIVMEHCGGGDLLQKIQNSQRLDESIASEVLLQISSALKFAHNQGIVHRDIKPENVVFINEKDIKVIDWGVSAVEVTKDCLRVMSSLEGTPPYMAPEVQDDQQRTYTEACDLWSLGALIYVMLFGTFPFDVDFKVSLEQKRAEQYVKWKDKAISLFAEDLIRSLLKSNPHHRLDIDGVLQHPWLAKAREGRRASPEAIRMVLQKIGNFAQTRGFFRLFSIMVTRNLDYDHLKEIYEVFSTMDIEHDGVLWLKEFRHAFKDSFGEDSKEFEGAADIFKKLDIDDSGTLDWIEFCAAAISPEEFINNKEALLAAFKEFDEDGDGFISEAEFVRKLCTCKYTSKNLCQEEARKLYTDCLQGYDLFPVVKNTFIDFAPAEPQSSIANRSQTWPQDEAGRTPESRAISEDRQLDVKGFEDLLWRLASPVTPEQTPQPTLQLTPEPSN